MPYDTDLLGAEALVTALDRTYRALERKPQRPIADAVRVVCGSAESGERVAMKLAATGFDVSRSPGCREVWVHTDALEALGEMLKTMEG